MADNTPVTTTRIVLAERPVGEPKDSDFRVETVELPEPASDEALLETLYLSLDPYMRGRMSAGKSYATPLEIGDTMVGATVSRVMTSGDDKFAPGDLVLGYSGWQTYAIAKTAHLRTLDPSTSPTTALGVLGMPGFTAYAGMRNIGKPKEGETVVVAAATGPVGSMVGQLAKLAGARAVGIAGGPEKVRILTEELGFDAGIDHRAEDFTEQLAAATPDGIDVYFENVGGKVLNAVVRRMNLYSRMPVCGLIADYNATALPDGHDRMGWFMRQILNQSMLVRGFIQGEFAPTQMNDFLTEITPLVAEGKIRYREDVVDGLDNAIEAFRGLLTGRNLGKLVIKVSD
ncbi:NADP-dependent oxidoreductase [Gordonia jinhuaensis]|uniref:NADP-dependent oxidoreductase n=1 Tax=Gordonia jinhuaensis TaxID=1517702 RepID=A0A916THB2_9ACTN|nr:NADP-dependent oxidoreductase [Gordonia jinhuaensis]GGB44832.1 NADP-dependent oxidoreductase [Gordonia jinhuaensis]